MARLLTLRRNLQRLLKRDEVDDNFVNVAADFSGSTDPATLSGAYVLPYAVGRHGHRLAQAAQRCE